MMNHEETILVQLLRDKRPEFYAQFSDKQIVACCDPARISKVISDLRSDMTKEGND